MSEVVTVAQVTRMPTRRACEECGESFRTTNARKRFCTERCQRKAENRRYRQRHTEPAVCKGCGIDFIRSKSDGHLKVYCTPRCMADSRSREYRARGIAPPIARRGIVRQPTSPEAA